MDEREFRRVAGAFRAFHRRFAPLFGRKEARRHGEQYVRGLVVQQAERRNAENLAEAVVGSQGRDARALQQFLTDSPWACDPVTAALQAYVAERLLPQDPQVAADGAASDGVFTLDSTGFAKRGTRSVGVARQYSGTLGKVDNCQIGVFLGSWGTPPRAGTRSSTGSSGCPASGSTTPSGAARPGCRRRSWRPATRARWPWGRRCSAGRGRPVRWLGVG